VEQYILNLDEDEKERVIESILDRMRSGDIAWTEEFVGGGGYMERFAKKNPKFIKRLSSALYSSIEGMKNLKRTEFRITSKADMGPRRRLKEVMDPIDYASLFMGAEAEV
jgi:hypothetical protein